jgi:hypothetical protein
VQLTSTKKKMNGKIRKFEKIKINQSKPEIKEIT